MKRTEAVVLLKELGSEHLIQPTFVIIQQREPDRYQLEIKGGYNRQLIEKFLSIRNFAFEENENYLVIFKP